MHRQITGIVCGQRTPLLTETLESLTSRYDAKIVAESQPEGPDVIRINIVSLDALQELTEEANMAFAPHIVEHLAMCIPSLEAWIASIPPVPCPAVPPIEYFDPSQRVWTSVDKVVADGLYRYEHFYPDYRLIHNGTCRKVSRELGIYRVLRERLWRYDTETHQLLIPVHLLPPPLYQRALVLCSGFLAQFDTKERYWLYRDVPPAVAYTLAEKLNQSLE
jgi:hypothetical protein